MFHNIPEMVSIRWGRTLLLKASFAAVNLHMRHAPSLFLSEMVQVFRFFHTILSLKQLLIYDLSQLVLESSVIHRRVFAEILGFHRLVGALQEKRRLSSWSSAIDSVLKSLCQW